MNTELDLTTDVDRDIIVVKNRTLNEYLRVDVYEKGIFQYPFDLTEYTGATMTIKLKANDFNNVLSFSTHDGSIVLGADGIFQLIKTADQMNVRSGQYVYDMYLTNSTYEKRALMSGKFIINDSITK